MPNTTITPKPAQRTVRKARLVLWGKSGSGKTLTALKIARGICGREGKIVVLDTEIDASTLYADEYDFDVVPIDAPYESRRRVEILKTVAPHYDVVILDHASAEWNDEGGCLERLDTEKLKLGNNEWAAWSKIIPDHHRLLSTLLRAPTHIICTLRAKTVTDQQTNPKTGKKEVIELGLFPVQRYDGEEFCYGMDIAARLDPEGTGVRLTVTNTRYRDWHGKSFHNPTEALGAELGAWLNKGIAPASPTTGEEDHPPRWVNPDDPFDMRTTPETTPPPTSTPQKPSIQASSFPASGGKPAAPPTRGELLNTITQELFRQVPARGEDSRKARGNLMHECFGEDNMTAIAKLNDDVLANGLKRLMTKGGVKPPTRKAATR
jgi:hypothetical protein